MNKSQALTKLSKVLGPKLGYRVEPKALDAAQRAEASANARLIQAKKSEVEAAMSARCNELLRDPQYQALKAERDSLEKDRATYIGHAHRARITVGVDSGMFFSVKAEGDNWDEVVEKVCAKETA